MNKMLAFEGKHYLLFVVAPSHPFQGIMIFGRGNVPMGVFHRATEGLAKQEYGAVYVDGQRGDAKKAEIGKLEFAGWDDGSALHVLGVETAHRRAMLADVDEAGTGGNQRRQLDQAFVPQAALKGGVGVLVTGEAGVVDEPLDDVLKVLQM